MEEKMSLLNDSFTILVRVVPKKSENVTWPDRGILKKRQASEETQSSSKKIENATDFFTPLPVEQGIT